jgi:hypothetical protein
MIDTMNSFHDEELGEKNKMQENVPLAQCSAFISDNPDFAPSKDSPLARSCDTMAGIIAND